MEIESQQVQGEEKISSNDLDKEQMSNKASIRNWDTIIKIAINIKFEFKKR